MRACRGFADTALGIADLSNAASVNRSLLNFRMVGNPEVARKPLWYGKAPPQLRFSAEESPNASWQR